MDSYAGSGWGGTYPDQVWRPLFRNLDPKQLVEIEGRWGNEARNRLLRIRAKEVSTFSDWLESPPGGGGVAAATQDFVVGGIELEYTDARSEVVTTTAVFDPKTGNVDAPRRERADFVRTTLLSARNYSSLIRDAQQYSFLLRIKQEGEVREGVGIIDDKIRRIEILSEPGGPSIYVDVGLEALIPIAVCGEGFVRLFSIVVQLTASRGGVLLIDEIDNGLHHTVMPRLWSLLNALSDKHDVQIFATTHNDEMMRSALESFAGTEGTLGLFRMDKRDDRHVMVGYSDEAMGVVREVPFEVRG